MIHIFSPPVGAKGGNSAAVRDGIRCVQKINFLNTLKYNVLQNKISNNLIFIVKLLDKRILTYYICRVKTIKEI